MGIIGQIKDKIKEAMINKDEASLLVYRGLLSAIHNKEIELKKKELAGEEVISVLESQAKQRRDSMVEFEKGGRADLVSKEKKELSLIEKFLPQKLGEAETEKLVEEAIKKTGASAIKDMGRVMAAVMSAAKGKIDGNLASKLTQKKLSP